MRRFSVPALGITAAPHGWKRETKWIVDSSYHGILGLGTRKSEVFAPPSDPKEITLAP